MTKENEIVEVHDATAETRVWQAVILQTVEEWINGPKRLSLQAERYLFSDNTDFPMVCLSAGMDVERLRKSLARVRDRIVRQERQELEFAVEPLAAVA
jgi:hypothetical protein